MNVTGHGAARTATQPGVAVAYLLRLGDDALIAAQRMAQWCARAPELEEDVALSNIALDLLGQARALLTYAGELEGAGRDEDALAYLRDDREFSNAQLVELPNGDFAVSMGKLLFFTVYQRLLYADLSAVRDERLAAIAAKSVKEATYHVEHALAWTMRLGVGTAQSHQRMQDAVDAIWPYTHELFATDEVCRAVEAQRTGVDPASLRQRWLAVVEPVLSEATLRRPVDGWAPSGGRVGLHTEHFGFLITEMQGLRRAHPGATW